MKKPRLPTAHLALAAALLLATSCGVFMAGTWEDDPKNWKRVFGFPKPEEVVLVHSKYWRSAHWTYEFAYSFEIDPTPKVKEELFANRLRQLSPQEAAEAKENLGPGEAAWFAPKSLSAYDVWVYDDLPMSAFKMFVDRESGHIFLNDYQL